MDPVKIADSDLQVINNSLADQFGRDTVSGQPIWRLIWSPDEIERRHGTFEDRESNGTLIRRVTETRDVPKYRQWNDKKYILERLVVVPDFQREDLAGVKFSYEPIFTLMDKNGEYLPPRLDVCELICQTVYAAQGKAPIKITDIDPNDKNGLDARKKRLEEISEYLWGNDTDLQSNLKFGHAVGFGVTPHNTGSTGKTHFS